MVSIKQNSDRDPNGWTGEKRNSWVPRRHAKADGMSLAHWDFSLLQNFNSNTQGFFSYIISLYFAVRLVVMTHKIKNEKETEKKFASLQNYVVMWRCPCAPSAVVEVMQNSPKVLEFLINTQPTANTEQPTPHCRLFILFPGNPGLVYYYDSFCKIMDERGFDILVMGFAGHSVADLNKGRHFTMQDQIHVADQFMHHLLNEVTKKKYANEIYIGGHSIGAFVAVHMLARHTSIRLLFGLCPVLSHIKASPRGQSFSSWGISLLKCAAACFGVIFSLSPVALRVFMLKKLDSSLAPSLLFLLAQHGNRHLLSNVLSMLGGEFDLVRSPDKYLLRSIQEKMVLYYVPKDGWAPEENAEEIHKLLPLLKAFVMENDNAGVLHAWCLGHNDIIAQNAILSFLPEMR